MRGWQRTVVGFYRTWLWSISRGRSRPGERPNLAQKKRERALGGGVQIGKEQMRQVTASSTTNPKTAAGSEAFLAAQQLAR